MESKVLGLVGNSGILGGYLRRGQSLGGEAQSESSIESMEKNVQLQGSRWFKVRTCRRRGRSSRASNLGLTVSGHYMRAFGVKRFAKSDNRSFRIWKRFSSG